MSVPTGWRIISMKSFGSGRSHGWALHGALPGDGDCHSGHLESGRLLRASGPHLPRERLRFLFADAGSTSSWLTVRSGSQRTAG